MVNTIPPGFLQIGKELRLIISKYNYHSLKMEDYNIPYSYSPILLCTRMIQMLFHMPNHFEATKKGFVYALKNKEESIEILKKTSLQMKKTLILVKHLI